MRVATPKVPRAVLRPSWHNYLANRVLSSSTDPSVFLDFKPTAPVEFPQRVHIYQRYAETLDSFQDLKPQLTALLYYQTSPSEQQTLLTAEKQNLLNQLVPLYTELRLLNFWLQDESASNALRFVEAALKLTNPSLLHSLQNAPFSTTFPQEPENLQYFYLYPEEGHPLPDPVLDLEGQHIAIINDDQSILQVFESWYDLGILLPGANVTTHGSAEQFLLWMQRTPHQPDIIFSDIQLGDGTGYYVAWQLRKNGFQGAMIALTSYAEDEKTAHFLKTQQFDGFVSLRSAAKVPLMQRITQAAQVYLQRKNTP